MAKRIVAKNPVSSVREDMKYDNDTLRGLSILLGSKSIEEHVAGLTEEQRSSITSYFGSSRDSAVSQLRTLGTLLSGYDENFQTVSAFEIGWLVSALADEAEAGGVLVDICTTADTLSYVRTLRAQA